MLRRATTSLAAIQVTAPTPTNTAEPAPTSTPTATIAPTATATGSREALELRDGDTKRYLGKGVLSAVGHVNGPIKTLLLGRDAAAQRELRATGCRHQRRKSHRGHRQRPR